MQNDGERTANRYTDLYMLYKIASYYYQDGLLQDEISALEQISRSQISRYLTRAKEEGIVRVSISLPEVPDISALERRLQSSLHLERVLIAPCHSSSETARTSAIASSGGVYLGEVLNGTHVVGFGWGRTLYETSLQIPYRKHTDNTLYVPLIGVSGVNNPIYQINTIIDRVAERRKGQGYYMALPTYRQKIIPIDSVDSVRINRLKSYWRVLDAAVFSLGTIRQSEQFMGEEARPLYNQKVRNSKAEAEILSQFFFKDGDLVDFDEDDYIQLAFALKDLKQVPLSICLAGGNEKVNGIIQGARLSYFKHLVTDQVTARLLDQAIEEENRR